MSFTLSGQRSLFGGAKSGGIVREKVGDNVLCRYEISTFENLKKTEIEMPSFENKMFSFFHTNKIRFAVHYPIWKNDDRSTEYKFSFVLFDSFGNITTLIDIDECDLCQDDGDNSYIPNNAEYLIYGKSQLTELCNYLLLKLSGVSVGDVVENSLQLARKEGFPFPTLELDRLKKSWLNLCGLHSSVSKSSTTGNDILRHFHQSIYAYTSGNTPSLLDAWEDDDILKKIIKNRILYSGVRIISGKAFVAPQTIVLGLNQSKVAAKISLFRPALARYLVEKYLNDRDYIYDPFMGFLGRALGAGSLGKKYRAGDINETTLKEVKEGCEFLGVDCELVLNDAWNSAIEDKFEPVEDWNKVGLLTCSPYSTNWKVEWDEDKGKFVEYSIGKNKAKEAWNDVGNDESTDNIPTYEWVERTLVLNPNINKFIFVLDNAGQFEEFIAEEIITDTVFAIVKEYVVVIDRSKLRPEHFMKGGGKLWERKLG